MQVNTIAGSRHAVVGLLVHKDNENVVVVHQCPCNGIVTLATEFDSPTRLTKDEFQRNGLAVILKSFAEYAQRKKSALSELESQLGPERQRFEQAHRHVHLTIYDENGLLIQPMNRSATGKTYGGTNREAVFLRFPFSNEDFIHGVQQALERTA